ncbi:MAG TPA: hypothetical protein PK020_05925 [Ilumatobacteraceae bacterium]|nr:hypothetical protein [Ilumatobacteraceae bacterium]HRB05295.1 hypothetical protein [Ilumatobacteraceae bacterium]
MGGGTNDTSGAGGTPQLADGTIEKLWIFGPGAAVAGGAVGGGFVAGGLVVGAAVAGVVAATVVGAATVVAAAATVVVVSVAIVVVVVSLLLEVASAESLLRDDVELQAPKSTSDVATTTARKRRFNIRRS